jgi:17beta-estradiol 17-dehydrogenase / very-long-chain 3-oxoacyl-CoA reductase
MEFLATSCEHFKHLTGTSSIAQAVIMTIGLLVVFQRMMALGRFIERHFIRKRIDLFKRYGGGWAVVTGGSEGIGLSYAKEFARMGFNVCIISRSEEKLEKAAKEIKFVNGAIIVEWVSFNFGQWYTEETYKPLVDALNRLDDISVLVNNVGVAGGGYFHEVNFEDISRQIQVNVCAQTYVTRIILPKLLERCDKKNLKCALIDLSSVGGDIRHPFLN